MSKLTDLTEELVQDKLLTDEDVDRILQCARDQAEQEPLPLKEIDQVYRIAAGESSKLHMDKLPLPLKILGVFLLISGLISIFLIVVAITALIGLHLELNVFGQTATTNTLVVLSILSSAVAAVLSFTTGLNMLKGRRGKAGRLMVTLVLIDIFGLVVAIMLYGTDQALLLNLTTITIKLVSGEYLNPSMTRLRRLRRGLDSLDTETHAKRGTLGLAEPGEGYIRLDFFNLFWTFVICCFLGLAVECIFHMTVVDPGVYQDRAGLLYGPFSPIYGFGAVLMTMALNRFKDKNVILLFVACTIIGGAFEYFVSWFMEVGFGAVAWDYSGHFLNIQGRTCLLYASMFGVLGVAWIKWLLPLLLKIINKIPWQLRSSITTICAVLMLVNCIMTLQALDNWYARVSGETPDDPIEEFYAKYYDNDVMPNRYQSMSITPEKTARDD